LKIIFSSPSLSTSPS